MRDMALESKRNRYNDNTVPWKPKAGTWTDPCALSVLILLAAVARQTGCQACLEAVTRNNKRSTGHQPTVATKPLPSPNSCGGTAHTVTPRMKPAPVGVKWKKKLKKKN